MAAGKKYMNQQKLKKFRDLYFFFFFMKDNVPFVYKNMEGPKLVLELVYRGAGPVLTSACRSGYRLVCGILNI